MINATLAGPCLPADLTIPPRPQAMLVLLEEMRSEQPKLTRIAQAIQADPGLAGAMLKAVNSPAFGLRRKATSIMQALSLLGLRNINAIATGLMLRYAMRQPQNIQLERFWDTAEKVALISAELARRLRGIPADEAYTFGLFHDCGIPLLMLRYPHYRETLTKANHGLGESFTKTEELAVGTHHGVVGYFVARSWHLPDAICQAILWHHDLEIFDARSEVSDTIRTFVGILHIAEHIHHQQLRSTEDSEWQRFGDKVLAYFALSEEEYLSLVDAAHDLLNAA